ncbi:hypothetical protein N5T79_06420 [Aliarcobacter cryaerophilus]|uniref:hypothetical protein n=1 Tax=Aliarcobacter cryaerophilus TaxID=28198 RepID=UPI0021B56177|nr:hypothetical protein [Aliarcobacter cryaerophilus]MCT7528776.1 hypothetical protein [Aliarcobacter cryaerophilus]
MLIGKVENSQGKVKLVIDNKLRCSCCGYLLDVSNFWKSKNTKSGYRCDCKTCAKRFNRDKVKKASTSGIIGIFLEKCAYQGCGINFTTKKQNKVFCSDKCKKRDWYEKNEQNKWKTTYKRSA